MRAVADLGITEREREALAEAKLALNERFPVEQIFLFGSKARGDDDDESDIDLLLLTSRLVDWRERQAMVDTLFDIGMRFDVIFSIVVVPSTEWRGGLHSVLPIHAEVDRDGVPL